MLANLFRARSLTVVVLLAILAIASACTSDGADVPTPAPGSTPELTAQEILDRATAASQSVKSLRGTGGFLAYGSSEEIQSATQRFDWASPDRFQQVTIATESGESIHSELISIGGRGYIRGGPISSGRDQWREIVIRSASGEPGQPPPLLSSLQSVVVDEGAEVVEVNGSVVYRISGIEPTDVPDQLPHIEQERTTRVILFIDTVTFLAVRSEQIMSVRETRKIEDVDSPDGVREEVEDFSIEGWMEFTYPSEAIVIEPPGDYVPLQGQDGGPDHTPTPLADFPTPTPVTSRGRTLGSASLAQVAPSDRLDLEEVTVVYEPCDPNSLVDRPPIMIVHSPSGSSAHLGFTHDANGDPTGTQFNRVVNSVEGSAAVQKVLNRPDLMELIMERSPKPARCPAEFANLLADELLSRPDSERHDINLETVAIFESCADESDMLVAPVVVTHLPTESMAGIVPGTPGTSMVSLGAPVRTQVPVSPAVGHETARRTGGDGSPRGAVRRLASVTPARVPAPAPPDPASATGRTMS